MQKKWIEVSCLDKKTVETSKPAEGDLHPVILQLLKQRGIEDAVMRQKFLNPDWETGVHDPDDFFQMKAAVLKILQALQKKEKITVHGDYDGDGVTGTALMVQTLREIEKLISSEPVVPSTGYRVQSTQSVVDYYIPHRDKEGYGLHPETVDELKQRGTKLLVTVDCGVCNVAEIARAKSLGIETVVVDHHAFAEQLPEAVIIHPKIPGETYPFHDLAAVGVAWKLACGLLKEARNRGMALPLGYEKWLLDLVAVGTVTDMVPLHGENRVIEAYGLKVLNKTRRPGLLQLFIKAGCSPGSITTETIAFSIGPRLNAAGRMGHASLALKLLLSESSEEAESLALELEGLNRARQKTTEKMMIEAEEQVKTGDDSKVLVLFSEVWAPSLVGLVAGKYLDKLGKPTVAIGKFDGRWVGSGRSFFDFDITEALKRSGEGLLSHVGGHVQACGFSFSEEHRIHELVQKIRADALVNLDKQDFGPSLMIDLELTPKEVTWKLVEELKMLEPFGEGNKRPVFITKRMMLIACDLVGSTQNHLRCSFRSENGFNMRFIGFKLGSRVHELDIGKYFDVVYDVGINEWNGNKNIQCRIIDFRTSET